MATPEETHPPSTPQDRVAARLAAEAKAATVAASPPKVPPPRTSPGTAGLALFGAALVVCLVAYLAASVPGAWFPRAAPLRWSAGDLVLSRGTGHLDNRELIVTAPDAAATVLITIETDFRSTDYRSMAWSAIDIPDQAEVWLLWRSDYIPNKLNTAPIQVAAGRLRPVEMSTQANWLGHVSGIALIVRGQLPLPIRIGGVEAKPMGALEILRDRFREWLVLERWSGTSINSVIGGADVQDLPLPPLLAAAAVLAALGSLVMLRRSGQARELPIAIATIFVAAWLAIDARWQWNLMRQAAETDSRYGGKDWHEKHRVAEDSAVFAFIEKVATKLPSPPARVFVVGDVHYFRDRAAYYLYPHNVFFDAYQNSLPPIASMHAGDYLVVYQRRGVQYDRAQQRLRVEGAAPVAAELLLNEQGSALFRIL